MLCLTCPTDPRWVERALADVPTLLVDHAHCEMKAASNALSLAARGFEDAGIARALVALAEEELLHFRQLLDEIELRGLVLGKPEVDVYAGNLRKLAQGEGRRPPIAVLVDRFLVGALIEARSCERFRLLADAFSARGEPRLGPLYEELFAVEARHYVTFLELAGRVAGGAVDVRARLAELAAQEGAMAAELGDHAVVHG